jgi:glycosyltransferase involved in cell wall biosynthesis
MPNYPSGQYFSGYGIAGPFQEEYLGVAVSRVPVVPRGRGRAGRLFLNYLSYALLASLRLASQRGKRWDVAIVFQPTPITTIVPALVLRALKGVPIVTWVQDLWPETIAASGVVRSKLMVRAVAPFCRWLYRRCDYLLAQSLAYLPHLEDAGIDAARLTYVPNWAEEIYTAPPVTCEDEARQAWEEGFVVMFAGNLGRVQALETILGAAECVKDLTVHWVFVGDGSLRHWLEAEVGRRHLGNRVHILGRRPVQEMPRLFARAGTLLVTLKRGHVLSLTIPSKIQSYLAAGSPIIGSLDGEGARVINESGAGWATPAEDAELLAHSIRRMASLTAHERARMGQRGRSYYEEYFGRGLCIDKVERVITQASQKRKAA